MEVCNKTELIANKIQNRIKQKVRETGVTKLLVCMIIELNHFYTVS